MTAQGLVATEQQAFEESQPASANAAALSLSGGGYRAMVFHVGALWRLNEVGLLGKLKRISSVSGGSITAGVLALCWKELQGACNPFRRQPGKCFCGA